MSFVNLICLFEILDLEYFYNKSSTVPNNVGGLLLKDMLFGVRISAQFYQ